MKKFLLDLIFPKKCFGCKKEKTFLCQDCKSVLDILNLHQKEKFSPLDDLYFALFYKHPLLKKMIFAFKYQGVKELAFDLANLILDHFQLIEKKPQFLNDPSQYFILPIPLSKEKLKFRGYNQAEEIAKVLSQKLKIPILRNVLIKIKETFPQIELSEKERKENIKDAFFVKEGVSNKKILLVDDIFTTGATMREAARVLKEAGAKIVIGIVIARAMIGEDKFE